MEPFYLSVGKACCVLISIGFFGFGVATCIVAWIGRRDRALRDKLVARIMLMQRWCSYDFPILDDAATHLLEGTDVSEFRESLRFTYKPGVPHA